MKIAVPTAGNVVDDHFGHCQFYTIFTIDNNSVINKEILPSPQGCGCKSNIASVLAEMGVKYMLAGNMGQGALNVLNNNGIDVLRGNSGDVDALVSEFLKGSLTDSGEGCNHTHGADHVCSSH